MTGWTVELGQGGTLGGLTEYPKAVPVHFLSRLNGVGFFRAMVLDVGANPDPARDDLIRFIYDKGGAAEQKHFEGVVTDVRRHPELSQVFAVKGLDANGLLWQMGPGSIREWRAETPHEIVQGVGPPDPLLDNSQGNRKPVGATTLQYGTAADVPWKVTATNPGLSMDFRADSKNSWLALQRLFLQARHTQTEYPAWAEEGGPNVGDIYGLDGYVRIEADAEPRFYLVGRKERSTNHTPETWVLGTDVDKARRGVEGLTAAQAIKVIGSGAGKQRVESVLVGTGGIEGILADKTIIGATEAENQARRLSTLLDPDVEVITGTTHRHDQATRVGDRVTFQEAGKADTTLRIFALGYRLTKRKQRFYFVAGRPRALAEDSWKEAAALSGGHAQGTQRMAQEDLGVGDANAAAVADNGSVTATVVLSRSPLMASLEQFSIRAVWDFDEGADADLEVVFRQNSPLIEVFPTQKRITRTGFAASDTEMLIYTEGYLEQLGASLDQIDEVDLELTNRSGAAMDLLISGRVWVQD